MKTFLKIALIVVLALLALKFLPLVLVGGLVGLLVAALLGVLGVSLIMVLLAVALGVACALSPIWIPVLVVMGAISLFRKLDAKPAVPPVIPA